MLTGIALKVAATLVFALMSAVVKFQSAEFGVAEIVFFRSFFALIVTVLWLIWRGQFPQQLQTARPFGHILRSTTGGTSMALSFAALAVLPLPDVTALGYTTPLLIVVIAAFLLREPVNASEVPTLHRTSKALTKCCTCHVNKLTDNEVICSDFSADWDELILWDAEFSELQLRLNLCDCEALTLRLRHVFDLCATDTNLQGSIAVLIHSSVRDNLTAVELQNRDRYMFARI